jgi:hypothetical protein
MVAKEKLGTRLGILVAGFQNICLVQEIGLLFLLLRGQERVNNHHKNHHTSPTIIIY